MQASVKRAGRRPRTSQSAIAVIEGCNETMMAACSGPVIDRPAKTRSGDPVKPINPSRDAGHMRPW